MFSAAYNYTGTEVTGETGLLGEGDIVALENYVPDTRWNVSVTQRVGRVSILGRLNYYGSWIDSWDAKLLGRGKASPVFGGKPIVDLEVSMATRRRGHTGTRRAECLQHILGQVRERLHRHRRCADHHAFLRHALQPVHAVGLQRRLLLCPSQLFLRNGFP